MTSITKAVRHHIANLAGPLAMLALCATAPNLAGAADNTGAVPGLTIHRGSDILAAKDQAARAKVFQTQTGEQSATGALHHDATGVMVVRGHGAQSPSSFEASVAAIKQPRFDVIAADGGWFIDREAGRLINCFRERTAAVGGHRIRCASRPLP